MTPTLYLGPRNYSSWSLRPWLVLRWGNINFEEQFIALDQPGYGRGQIVAVKAVSPNGKVPALQHNGTTIWDSLAISEWAAEQNAELWPHDPAVRAVARAATAEMHAGFEGIRREMPMNIQRRKTHDQWSEDTERDLSRLFELWQNCRTTYADVGPWLFGTRSIADAFYTPVATRLRTYDIGLDDVCQAYVNTLLQDQDFQAWEHDCVSDVWDKPGYPVLDKLYDE
ncbi:MAG: glutathione S-transferase family protein [Pseudomonadota bacterium]